MFVPREQWRNSFDLHHKALIFELETIRWRSLVATVALRRTRNHFETTRLTILTKLTSDE